jgi:lipopolysaccharide/colanic/teichoic acid biosynthesis glycosyltransferase
MRLGTKQDYLKRVVDIGISGTALLLLAPILGLVWIAIKIEDGGPAVYVSRRVGAGYRIFNLYKFRSMFMDADQRLAELASQNQYASPDRAEAPLACKECSAEHGPCSPVMMMDDGPLCEREWLRRSGAGNDGAFLKFTNDPRVTKVGRFIRKTSLDELPQLVNVLKGDMSVVGNRPLPLYEAQALTKDHSIARFLAPAGLTGLWQVTKRGGKAMSAEERIALDNEYASHRSLLGDLTIILKTVPALLQTEDV